MHAPLDEGYLNRRAARRLCRAAPSQSGPIEIVTAFLTGGCLVLCDGESHGKPGMAVQEKSSPCAVGYPPSHRISLLHCRAECRHELHSQASWVGALSAGGLRPRRRARRARGFRPLLVSLHSTASRAAKPQDQAKDRAVYLLVIQRVSADPDQHVKPDMSATNTVRAKLIRRLICSLRAMVEILYPSSSQHPHPHPMPPTLKRRASSRDLQAPAIDGLHQLLHGCLALLRIHLTQLLMESVALFVTPVAAGN